MIKQTYPILFKKIIIFNSEKLLFINFNNDINWINTQLIFRVFNKNIFYKKCIFKKSYDKNKNNYLNIFNSILNLINEKYLNAISMKYTQKIN